MQTSRLPAPPKPAIASAKAEVNHVLESLSQVSKAAKGADADKENAVAPNHRPATGDSATRKRKTSTSSQQSHQPTSKRPVLGTVAELDMTWEELKASTGLDVPQLMVKKLPSTLRMDIKGQRDWFREQHGFLRTYAKHIQEMEADLLRQQGEMMSKLAEQESTRKAELDAMAATQSALEMEIDEAKRVCDTIEGNLREATAREADLTRDFTEATAAIQAAQAQIAKREEEKSKAEAEANAAQTSLRSLTDDYAKTQQYANSLQEYNNKLTQDMATHTAAMERAVGEKNALSEEHAALKGAHTAAAAELEAVKAAVAKADASVVALKEELGQVQVEKTALSEEHAALKGVHTATLAELQAARTAAEKAEAAAAALKEELDQAQGDKATLSGEHAELKGVHTATLAELQAARTAAEKAEAAAAALKEELDQAQGDKTTLSEAHATLMAAHGTATEQLTAAEAAAEAAEAEAAALRQKGAQLEVELATATDARGSLEMALATLTASSAAMQGELATTQAAAAATAAELTALSSTHVALQTSNAHQIDQATQRLEALETELARMRERAEQAELLGGDATAQFRALQQRVTTLETALSNAEEKCKVSELTRRRLHNTVMELKGNIRVFCRVRPLSEVETEGAAVAFPGGGDDQSIELSLSATGVQDGAVKALKHAFSFDRVFQPQCGQQVVFEEITELVQSALDGYKVCIFAYGQTGSGKTHTMMGSPGEVGMIPRSLQQIFSKAAELSRQAWTFHVKVSMLEIYNEEIRDLLGDGKTAKHNIMHDSKGNTVVSDLKVLDVSNTEQAEALLEQAAGARSVEATNANARSSRSHCVFTLHLHGHNTETGVDTHGIINLIDLAGSERLSKSGATGGRLKETQAINKSLSCLGDVIYSLANREAHVPYRNSKLTYLLQPCLGGDGKTLMFVNVAPTQDSAQETLCSLRFAAKVNTCERKAGKDAAPAAKRASTRLNRTESLK